MVANDLLLMIRLYFPVAHTHLAQARAAAGVISSYSQIVALAVHRKSHVFAILI